MLSIGVKHNDVVYVGNTRVKVVSTRSFESMEIEVNGKPFLITSAKMTEIMPKVLVSCGRPDQRFVDKHHRLMKSYQDAMRVGNTAVENPGSLLPRINFEAPRDIVILREELYLAAKDRAAAA